MFNNSALYIGLIFLLFFNCREDETIIDDPILISTQEPILLDGYIKPYQAVTATVYGQIFNDNEEPLEGVRITAEGHETITDKYGLFNLSELTFNAEGTLVQAGLDGYIMGSRTFYPESGSVTRIRVNLISKDLTETFESSVGGLIQVDGGPSIQFEPNSIVLAGGGVYEGSVNVFAKYLDPTKLETILEMPGDLSGIRPTDLFSETGLKSFGMLLVELYSDDNVKLQLAESRPAEINLPIPVELLSEAPETIPLWYFNETVGKWVEEGDAILEDGRYKGNVKHFSFWNCDIPVEYTTLCLSFKDERGTPIIGMEVFIKSGNFGIGSGITDADGLVSGIVPANDVLSICTGAIVNGATWSIDIGSISSKTNLDYVINITDLIQINPKFKVIPGHLTCEGQDVEEALMRVESNNGVTFYEINEQPFDIFHYLDEGEEIQQVQVTDLNTQASTQEITVVDAPAIIWVNDYELCFPENEEYFMLKSLIGGQWYDKDEVTMWKADFVSPGVIQIQAVLTDNVSNIESSITMNIHDVQGPGDYSGTMTHEGKKFAKASIGFGGETFSWASGSPQSFVLNSVDENGYIEGEFSGQLLSASSNNPTSLRGYFGKFRVKYEEPELNESYIETIFNENRQVKTGLRGEVLNNTFIVEPNSLTPTINFSIAGTTAGDYTASHIMSHFFNILNFNVPSQRMGSFNVTEFEEIGGFVEGIFEGENKNPIYLNDDTLYPVYGSFSILNQE